MSLCLPHQFEHMSRLDWQRLSKFFAFGFLDSQNLHLFRSTGMLQCSEVTKLLISFYIRTMNVSDVSRETNLKKIKILAGKGDML